MMRSTKSKGNSRAGLYISPEARDRLNRFIAQRRLLTDSFMSQSMAIDYLIDHYEATSHLAVRRSEPARELA